MYRRDPSRLGIRAVQSSFNAETSQPILAFHFVTSLIKKKATPD